jgi:hypothetical protein
MFLFRTNVSDLGRHPIGPGTAPAVVLNSTVLFLKLNPCFHSADSNLFLRIDSAELLIWVQEQSEEKSPNLTKFTEHFNNMSYWTRTLILNQPDGKVICTSILYLRALLVGLFFSGILILIISSRFIPNRSFRVRPS